MLVVLKSNYEELSREAAQIIANAVRHNPTARLGLATGSTTLGVYRELARLHRDESLDFSRVITFNLDEYLGIPPEHLHSFHHFMLENFFSQVNINPRNVHIPDGTITGDYEKYCASYEDRHPARRRHRSAAPGHRPQRSYRLQRTHLQLRVKNQVESAQQGHLDDNRKFFGPGETIPRCAITMGIGTILASRRVLMLATGAAKAAAVANAIEGPITASVTASALQLHPDATAILDEEAAAQLKQKDYYRDVMEMTALFTPGRLS